MYEGTNDRTRKFHQYARFPEQYWIDVMRHLSKRATTLNVINAVKKTYQHRATSIPHPGMRFVSSRKRSKDTRLTNEEMVEFDQRGHVTINVEAGNLRRIRMKVQQWLTQMAQEGDRFDLKSKVGEEGIGLQRHALNFLQLHVGEIRYDERCKQLADTLSVTSTEKEIYQRQNRVQEKVKKRNFDVFIKVLHSGTEISKIPLAQYMKNSKMAEILGLGKDAEVRISWRWTPHSRTY